MKEIHRIPDPILRSTTGLGMATLASPRAEQARPWSSWQVYLGQIGQKRGQINKQHSGPPDGKYKDKISHPLCKNCICYRNFSSTSRSLDLRIRTKYSGGVLRRPYAPTREKGLMMMMMMMMMMTAKHFQYKLHFHSVCYLLAINVQFKVKFELLSGKFCF